ncbi:MAG: HD domain-containing protein [Carbonactinosporaceae bacterium]
MADAMTEPSTPFTLADAVALARRAHAGQVDKAGRPYIEHPLRVMAKVREERVRQVAVLHDVLEDTTVTAPDLRAAGCRGDVVDAVLALTKRPGESLAQSMARARANPLARTVKAADVDDNMDPSRLALLPTETADRLRAKYAASLRWLNAGDRGTGR